MVLIAIGFLLLHAVLVHSFPAHAMAASYVFLVAAPLIAFAAVLYRGRISGFGLAGGWSPVALSLLLWALGMISSLRLDLLGNDNAAPGESMLLYILYGVPVFYTVATVGVENSSRMQRGIDAVLALSLGGLYFALMFSWTTMQGVSSRQSAEMISTMFDVENVFLAATTTVRFLAADTPGRRHLFAALAAFTCLYAVVAAYYNHHVALDVMPDIGSLYDLVIDVPFLLLAAMAFHTPVQAAAEPRPPIGFVRFVRFVRSGSPLLLALSVLVVALFLLRPRFNLGVAGIVVAVLGYGLRSILGQVRHIETEDRLREDQTKLADLALRDGLTGIPNRRAFDEALAREWSAVQRRQQAVSLLMIDIDLFKHYNDRYGHTAGDTCLCRVANALQQAMQRPADLLARYGGEEFVFILPGTTLAGAREVAERLCREVRSLDIPHEDSPLHRLTISVGLASIVPAGASPQKTLIDAADRALYEAKRRGRNRVEQADAPP